MRYLTRTIIVLVVLGLATANPAPAQTNPQGKVQTFTISGNTSLAGVLMKGLPGNPVSDQSGFYNATVESGWSGTVTPMKEGYSFRPVSKIYHNVNSDRTNENYVPEMITNTISGKVGLSGVKMQGLPGNIVTNENGLYSATVEYGWSGTVKPVKEGYSFRPAFKVYNKVISDFTNENYASEIATYTISGRVMIPSVAIQGLPPVLLSSIVMQGLPGNPVTDNTGDYGVSVPYGWTGTVEPAKEGYTFMPARREYTKVIMDLSNQNYTAEQLPQMQWQYGRGGWEPPGAGAGTGTLRTRRTGSSTGDRSRARMAVGPVAGRKVLVVPDEQLRPEELSSVIEDMQIMSHILDERFKETRRVQGVFTDFGDFFGRDNRQTEAIYLQGYGVLFSMEVNFAFSPAPKPQPQQAAEPNEQVDSTWEKAKQQVFSPGETRGGRGSGSTQESDSQMVEELKRDLITTLKHAANIRGVQPDERIILTVIGGGRESGGGFGGGGFMMGGMGGIYESTPYGGTASGGMGGFGGGYGVSGGSSGYVGGMAGRMGGGMGGFGGGMGGFGGAGISSATVLTIRAKKSDIDAFAKGEQDYEQFRQKVQIFTY
jgi:hypothetical protein